MGTLVCVLGGGGGGAGGGQRLSTSCAGGERGRGDESGCLCVRRGDRRRGRAAGHHTAEHARVCLYLPLLPGAHPHRCTSPHTTRTGTPPPQTPNATPPGRRLIQLELERLGLHTDYRRLQVDLLGDDHWRGVRSKYWRWPWYFLPVCSRRAAEGGDGGNGGGGGKGGNGAAGGAAAEAAV